MPSNRPRERFKDIIENIDAISAYTDGMSKERFIADRKTCDATERCFARISEAASKLGLLAEELAPKQPWNDIRGLGNWLRHDYAGIITDIIWKTVTEDVVGLRSDCEAAIRTIEHQDQES